MHVICFNSNENWLQQPPLQLRYLTIHPGSSFQKFPRSIGRLRHLKKLCLIPILNSPICVQNLPKGFCNLQSLEHLELQYLEGLSSLPRRFGDLTNLRHLNLADCRQLKTLPDSFKQLKHLQYLNLEGCINLTFTQHNVNILEKITMLEELCFKGCKGLQVLPYHITRQEFLRVLDLQGTSLTELPDSIGQLKRLEVLKIGSAELESLPDSLGNLSSLTVLDIIDCHEMRSLPDSLGRLALLKSLRIWSSGVEFLPKAFGHLINLQRLSIDRAPIRKLNFGLEESSSLPRLESIRLVSTRLSTISIPEDFCPNLRHLAVEGNNFLEEIRTLPRTVKEIILSHCERLKDIACIGSLGNLQRLRIEACRELAELPSFAEFASIKEIEINGCPISGKMEGLEQLTSLETLKGLKLQADSTGTVEGCIKTLEKWPGEVTIFTRALGGVESVVKAFTSSNLMVVEACADGDDGAEETERKNEDNVDDEDDGDEEADEDGCRKPYLSVTESSSEWGRNWRLEDRRTCLSHGATIGCFVFNSHGLSGIQLGEATWRAIHGEGKWVCIRAISQGTESDEVMGLSHAARVEKGLVGRGGEREVKDVFCRLLDALKM